MNREHSSRGYKVVTGTSEVEVSFYGFTVTEEVVISALTAPTKRGLDEPASYDGDEAGLEGLSLPPGYYPIRGEAVTLTSGKLILWRE